MFVQRHITTIRLPGADDVVQESAAQEAGQANLSEVAAGQATTEMAFALDVSACKAFALMVDGPCTIKTNSSAEPDDTLTFAGSQGRYTWDADSPTEETFLLTSDVTAIFVEVAGEAAVNVNIRALYDPTPA